METAKVVGTATTELDRNRRISCPSHAIQDKPRGQVVGGNLPVVLTKLLSLVSCKFQSFIGKSGFL